METLIFKQWLQQQEGTDVVYNPKIKVKRHSDWNYEGSPGLTGVSPKEWPVGFKPKKDKHESK